MTIVLEIFLAIYLSGLGLGSVWIVYQLWPESAQLSEAEVPVRILGRITNMPRERHLLSLILLMGLIGGCAYALWWFSHRTATGEIQNAHVMWYLLRPWASCLVGLIFYGLFRSGLFVANLGHSKDINAYGMAGLAGAAGFFANQVLDKIAGLLQ